MELSENIDQFEALGLRVYALTYDPQAASHEFTVRQDIRVPIMSDPDSAIIESFGLLNDKIPENTRYYGVPYPGIFFVSADGKIAAKQAEQDYKERPPLQLVIETAAQLSSDATRE